MILFSIDCLKVSINRKWKNAFIGHTCLLPVNENKCFSTNRMQDGRWPYRHENNLMLLKSSSRGLIKKS